MMHALNVFAVAVRGGAMAGALALALLPAAAWSAGVVPETSLVVVEEGDGEGVINVKNTDAHASLMYVRLENLPEDPEQLFAGDAANFQGGGWGETTGPFFVEIAAAAADRTADAGVFRGDSCGVR
ncbi:hypothetical protein JOS77_27530 [Chromobacterium haemolyticum]|nr:hypothetical protein JOS77_27530 [Chromobacterium haemolyticum]